MKSYVWSNLNEQNDASAEGAGKQEATTQASAAEKAVGMSRNSRCPERRSIPGCH
jgi:hypothetical protein